MTAQEKALHLAGGVADCEGCGSIAERARITSAWSAETSADDRWSPENPALGQCAVTALVVQDIYGGDLLRVVNEGVSHYFNRLPNGVELDLTRGQFATWEPTKAEIRDRAYVLSFPATAQRYSLLRDRIEVTP